MHSLTKSLGLSEIVYVLAEEANFLLGAAVLTKNLPNIFFFIVPQDKIRSVARRSVGPRTLPPTRKALKVAPTPVASNYVSGYDIGSLAIEDA